jgi:hypothetical protein
MHAVPFSKPGVTFIICIYVTENDLDQLNPMDYGPADIEDDDARVFHYQS